MTLGQSLSQDLKTAVSLHTNRVKPALIHSGSGEQAEKTTSVVFISHCDGCYGELIIFKYTHIQQTHCNSNIHLSCLCPSD